MDHIAVTDLLLYRESHDTQTSDHNKAQEVEQKGCEMLSADFL